MYTSPTDAGGVNKQLVYHCSNLDRSSHDYLCPLIQMCMLQVGIGIVVMQQSDNQDDCPACYWANCQNHAYMHIKEKVSMHA
jgi:hypothetical protein